MSAYQIYYTLRQQFLTDLEALEAINEMREKFGIEFFNDPTKAYLMQIALKESKKGRTWWEKIVEWIFIPRFYQVRTSILDAWEDILRRENRESEGSS